MQLISKTGTAPLFYMDEIRLEESGGATFKMDLGTDEIMYLDEIQLTLRDTIPSTLADATMNLFDPDVWLGVTMVSGLSYVRRDTWGDPTSATVRKPLDILQLPGTRYDISSDGTQSMLRLHSSFDEPLVIDGTVGDYISYGISEDLSGLDFFRIGFKGRIETIG